MANPYPTGTSTPQDTPSFARRDNDELTPNGVERLVNWTPEIAVTPRWAARSLEPTTLAGTYPVKPTKECLAFY